MKIYDNHGTFIVPDDGTPLVSYWVAVREKGVPKDKGLFMGSSSTSKASMEKFAEDVEQGRTGYGTGCKAIMFERTIRKIKR